MNNPSFHILTVSIALLSCIYVTKCQLSLWNIRLPSVLQSPYEYRNGFLFGSSRPGRHIPEFPALDPFITEQRASPYVRDYGLHAHTCHFNYDLLNPKIIEATRERISSCSNHLGNCYYAEHNKFRTIDGSCNNLHNPSWGKSGTCLQRILPFDYADKISYPRESCTGKPLPNARHISNVFHRETKLVHDEFTTHFMEWGQMVAHDLTLNDIFRIPETGYNTAINCCLSGPLIDDSCFSIPVPPKDPSYPKNVNCISFTRTVPCPHCDERNGQRAHWNQNTAYHDLSLVYGSTEEEALNLRSHQRGMLKVEYNKKSGPMLPTVSLEENCISPPQEKSCYHAGDARSNQNPWLLTVHTYLMRHHNFICQELNEINPHWDDERLYQEARRINIAVAQFITYRKYLPNVLGEIVEKEGLNVLSGAKYTKYDPHLDASIADEYSAFAARYGHTLIPGRISEIDTKTFHQDHIRLRDFYYRPFGFRYGQYDKIAQGMTVDMKMKHDVFLGDDVRNFLYRRVYLNETVGLDLAAVSIIRGRDHGLPGYTYYLSYFFNITVHTFDDLRKMLPHKSVDLLEELYESVHDVDVYSAGLAEYYVPGGFIGPTFGAVLGEQYKRTKFGDRYWFEHGNEAGSFTPEQLLEIKRSSISRILCETTKIIEIQRNAFFPPSIKNPIVLCETLHRFNFHLWKE